MHLVLLCSLFLISSVHSNDTLIPIDRIRSVVISPMRTVVITERDLERPSVTGTERTLDNLEFENKVVLQAEELKFNMPEDAIEKHIANIQKKYDTDEEQFEQMLADSDYTFGLFKNELYRGQMVGNMLEFKVFSKAIVPYQEVVDYYDQHPIFAEPRYKISTTIVSKNRTRRQLETIVRDNLVDAFKWPEAFWINESEIAQDKMFITKMAVNSMYLVEERDTYRIYRLLEKEEAQLIPFEERYHEIAALLKEPLGQKLYNDYQDYLKNYTTVLRFD